MYNHYLDDDSFVLLDPEPQGPQPQNHPGQQHHGPSQGNQGQQHHGSGQGNQSQHHPSSPSQHRPLEPMRPKNDLLKDVTGGLSQLLDGVLKHFSLKNFDTGDILLVLIILFLYLEDGDNLELVITLGLLLLLGLDNGEAQG